MQLVHTEEVSVRNFVPAPIAALCSAGRKGDSQVEQKSDWAAVEVAGVACGFPRTPEGRDQLLRQVRPITTKLDPATARSPWEHCYGVESTGLWMKAGEMKWVQRNLNVSSKDGLAGRSAGRTGHSTRGKAVRAHLGTSLCELTQAARDLFGVTRCELAHTPLRSAHGAVGVHRRNRISRKRCS
jgi:hypothetical protein